MLQAAKKILKSAVTGMGIGYRIVHGIDYQRLSQYISKINRHRDIDAIIIEISSCLKDILDYELFGFVLKNESSMDIWIDPRAYSNMFKRTAITASFGVASIENKREVDSLLRESDERLYKAKSMGKNTVVPSLLPCFGDSHYVAKRESRKYSEAASMA